jgi:hypothetical protein
MKWMAGFRWRLIGLRDSSVSGPGIGLWLIAGLSG